MGPLPELAAHRLTRTTTQGCLSRPFGDGSASSRFYREGAFYFCLPCHAELVSASHLLNNENVRRKFTCYIYILTNQNNTTFYIGVTNSILKRTFEHRAKLEDGFTKRYNLNKLVYVEEYKDINEAIQREKQLKRWHRDWKINLIRRVNPEFNDLFIQT